VIEILDGIAGSRRADLERAGPVLRHTSLGLFPAGKNFASWRGKAWEFGGQHPLATKLVVRDQE